jgi:succinate dehydrogenase / fumarate reductase flavoprotein subunit
MNDLVGIIRKAGEIAEALGRLDKLRERFKNIKVEGQRRYNPGWNLAIDMRNMLMVSECVAKAALERTESRGGHTRDDHPGMDPSWRKQLLVCRAAGGDAVIPDISVTHEDQIPVREDLLELFQISELEKYFTAEELADHPGRRSE